MSRRERAERRRLELYLARILREIESKAPVIAGQRRDYRRALQSYEQLSRKLDEALRDASSLREALTSAQKERDTNVKEATELQRQTDDLARQVPKGSAEREAPRG